VTLSTHVLDLESGRPAPGIVVQVDRLDGADWTPCGEGVTDGDGRTGDLVPAGLWEAGHWRICFETAGYHSPAAFYPRVIVELLVVAPATHHHVPLLLNRHGYTTYRGS
jgi:hydroxyisourate hydrolase